jgi:hypothetical protein
MTGEEPETNDGAEGDLDENDPMSALLKRSLDSTEKATPPPQDLLRGVQKRIRVRSRGKFYADGWSTSTSRVSYMLIAALMLLAVALAYFALGPMGVSVP